MSHKLVQAPSVHGEHTVLTLTPNTSTLSCYSMSQVLVPDKKDLDIVSQMAPGAPSSIVLVNTPRPNNTGGKAGRGVTSVPI